MNSKKVVSVAFVTLRYKSIMLRLNHLDGLSETSLRICLLRYFPQVLNQSYV